MKKFVTIIAALACVYLIYCVFFGSWGNAETKPSTATITAEQQSTATITINETPTVTVGDIIEMSAGFKGVRSSHWMVKGSDPKQRGTFMSPITQNGYIGMSKYVSWEEFTKVKPRVIPIHSEEWVKIIRLYMGPDYANSYSLAP